MIYFLLNLFQALSLASEEGGGRCTHKWTFILHSRLKSNWKKGKFRATSIPLAQGSVIGHDQKHLTIWEPRPDNLSWDVSIYQVNLKR